MGNVHNEYGRKVTHHEEQAGNKIDGVEKNVWKAERKRKIEIKVVKEIK